MDLNTTRSILFEQFVIDAIHKAGLSDRIHSHQIIDQEGNLRYLSYIAPKISRGISIRFHNEQWELFAQISSVYSIKRISKDIDVVLTALKLEIDQCWGGH